MIHNQIINDIITSFTIGIAYLLIGKIVLDKKIKLVTKNIIIMIIFSLIILTIYFLSNNFIKMLPLFIAMTIVFKEIFGENFSKGIVAAFISYGIIFLGELLYVFLTSAIFGKDFLSKENLSRNNIINNIFISVISIIIALLLRKKIHKIIKNINDKKNIINISLCLIIILTLGILAYKIYSSNFVINEYFIINGILIIVAFIIGVYLFVQKLKINSVEQQYQQFVSYSREIEEMVEEYRILQHEFKNELIIIREMLDYKNKKVKDYVNNLLKEKNMSKYLWAQELKNIPLDSLKGFLNYKVLHMINAGIDVNITVSKEVKTSGIKDFDANPKKQLYNIIGVYVDNAIEAATESKKKEIKIDVFRNGDSICFIIANTYKGKIEIDRVDEPGFSTKKKGHGYGLTLVRNILNSTDLFSQERELNKNLYVQKLHIKIKKDKLK